MIEIFLDLAQAFGLSTSAGLNAYIPLLATALFAKFTPWITLEEPWTFLTSWGIIALITVLLLIETFADKIPVVDNVNNIVQTLVRPTAGAIVFAASTQSNINIHPAFALGCGVLLAGSVHVVKSGSRPVLAAMTGGVADPVVSTIEDIIATLTTFIALIFPWLIVLWLILLLALVVMVMRWRRNRRMA